MVLTLTYYLNGNNVKNLRPASKYTVGSVDFFLNHKLLKIQEHFKRGYSKGKTRKTTVGKKIHI